MSKVYVSLGSNCEIALRLREQNKRVFSLPYDWVVAFGDITKAFINKFEGFIDNATNVVHEPTNSNYPVNKEYRVWFYHSQAQNYKETINRRVKRLLDLLESDNELVFLRFGHWDVHHKEELEVCGSSTEVDEYTDMIKLKKHLQATYPKLKFKIYLYGACSKCPIPDTDDGILITNHYFNPELLRNI